MAAPFAEHEAFVCGPAAFMGAVKQALRELGLPKKRRHIETFVSLAGNPFESSERAPAEPAPTVPGSADDASVTVTLDGKTATYSWPRQQKLLDMLLERSLDAPFSCREGQCSACAYRLLSGEVHMLHNEILEQEDLDEDIRLGCQSLPVSDAVEISYE